MLRRAIAATGAGLMLLAGVVWVAPDAATAAPTSGWASWTPITGAGNDYRTTMQLPAGGFPRAVVASDSRSNVALPSGATTYLRTSTPVGAAYGTSQGEAYLNLRPKADTATAPSTTTYAFDSPTPPAGWTFVLGDVDSDQVRIIAKDADGTTLSATVVDGWFRGSFNYAGDTDQPTWDPATSTLTGNPDALDTNGASAWFEPDVPLSSLTFVFTRRAGFPVFQTWFASRARTISGTVGDVSTGGGSCPAEDATLTLIGPDGRELGTTQPAPDGTYGFGQYATQDGYTVRLDRPAGCAVVGPVERAVSTLTADAQADFQLRRIVPQPVSGTITTTGGIAVGGVEVTLTPPGGDTPLVTRTDALGRYLFDDNPEISGYTVAVTDIPDGYRISGQAARTFDITPGTPVTGQDFTLTTEPTLSGQVTAADEPLSGVTVTLTPHAGGAPVTTTTDGDGTYRFPDLATNDYDISVTPPDGYDAVAPRSGVTVATVDVPGQDFALTRPGSLGGQVTVAGPTLTPLAQAQVTVDGPGGRFALLTDTAGNYFVDDLDPGTYTLTLTTPGGYEPPATPVRTVVITTAGEIRAGQDFVLPAVVVPPTPTVTPTPTPTPTPTVTPTATPTATPSPSATPTATPSPSDSPLPSPSPSSPAASPGAGGGSGFTGSLPYTGLPVDHLVDLAGVLFGAGVLLVAGSLWRRPQTSAARVRRFTDGG